MSEDEQLCDNGRQRRRQAMLDVQRRYYASRRPQRMLSGETPYIQRHFDQLWQAGNLQAGERICEWGAGLGRFSRKLAAAGLLVDAIELSPTQSVECATALQSWPQARVHTGDIAEVLRASDERFAAMLGFFLLHHLVELDECFAAAFERLRDGGRMVFCEPNPAHPLYPVQISLTPGMNWHAERGIYRLWPGQIRAAAHRAGFSRVEIGYYGALPRQPYNWLARFGRERALEPLVPHRVKPFQTITAWR